MPTSFRWKIPAASAASAFVACRTCTKCCEAHTMLRQFEVVALLAGAMTTTKVAAHSNSKPPRTGTARRAD
eukprot:2562529-Rhodomonas_salina.2